MTEVRSARVQKTLQIQIPPQAKCEQGTEKAGGVVVVLEDEDNHKSVDNDEG